MAKSSLPNTVPPSISPQLLAFCSTICGSKPQFVISVPLMRGSTSFCFQNVEKKIRKRGGSIAYGWAIWQVPKLYFEAEHHAVWVNKEGNLIDVSPQFAGRRRMVFLPDKDAVYDPLNVRDNIMQPDGATPEALAFVELGRRRIDLYQRCRVPGTFELRFDEADQLECAEINSAIQRVLAS